ncbi:hypothetical protein FQR65_LT05006 [Abscondita terminalis]|nr:hypothetical protein FQR65_LT05006 [Abscondita terminalis]
MASRLSENPAWKILLIEAGDYPSGNSEMPHTYSSLRRTKEDWSYATEPSETACCGLKNKQCLCPRGRALGGSSTINAMFYIRGNPKDYDSWAVEGWDYDSVLPYFQKFEDLQGVENDKLMGKAGELKITKSVKEGNPRRMFLEAYKELGFGEYSEKHPRGYFDAYTTIYNGTRCSTAKAFLSVMKNRNNAFLVLNAQVSKVLVSSDLTVTGVEMRVNGKMITVKATKEVILSAGSVNSAQILMNSGIGPKEHLDELGVPVVKNLRVGENLQDHVQFFGLAMKMGPNSLPQRVDLDTVDEWYKYVMHKSGPLSVTPLNNFLLYLDPKNRSIYPTLQLFYEAFPKNDPNDGLRKIQVTYNLPSESFKPHEEINKHSNLFYLMPALAYPKSVGKILLRSNDPFDPPRIFPNYFSDEEGEDLQAMLEGVRFFQELVKTKAFADYEPEMVHLDLENCRSFEPDSDDYWKCALKNIATTVYHLAGTCKMGPAEDPTAVVDSRLRVHGMKGLRVVDASIMPVMISANINPAVIMIGQKGSDMIIEDWKYDK